MAAVATRKNHNHGFTLIELIVVMVLISTMTAFALPKLRSSLFSNQLRKQPGHLLVLSPRSVKRPGAKELLSRYVMIVQTMC